MLSMIIAVLATEQPTADEANAMAIRAVEYLKANDPAKASSAFTDKYGPAVIEVLKVSCRMTRVSWSCMATTRAWSGAT